MKYLSIFLAKMVTLIFDQIIFGAKPFSQLAISPTHTKLFSVPCKELSTIENGSKVS
jgi:hypothetical protein